MVLSVFPQGDLQAVQRKRPATASFVFLILVRFGFLVGRVLGSARVSAPTRYITKHTPHNQL